MTLAAPVTIRAISEVTQWITTTVIRVENAEGAIDYRAPVGTSDLLFDLFINFSSWSRKSH